MFTRLEKGFSTAAVSKNLSSNDIQELENNSIYIIPGVYNYKDSDKPIKYIYYSLENDLVVGKGEDVGKDHEGRSGNYFFHNFIYPKNTFINPIKLIRLLEKHSLFKNSNIEGIKDFGIKLSDIVTLNPLEIDSALVRGILYACSHFDELKKPLVLIGDENEIIDFIEWLFEIVPLDLENKLTFDTYAYGSSSIDTMIRGFPEDSGYQESIPFSLKIYLKNMEFNKDFEFNNMSDSIYKFSEMASEKKYEEIRSYKNLQRELSKHNLSNLKENFKKIPDNLKFDIYKTYSSEFIEYIKATNDVELLELVLDFLNDLQIKKLFQSKEIKLQIAQKGGYEVIYKLLDWIYSQPNSEPYYYYYKLNRIWKAHLKWINSNLDIKILIKSIYLLSKYNKSQFEEDILKKIISNLETIKREERYRSSLWNNLFTLEESEDENINFLRGYINYELTEKEQYLQPLINSSVISENQEILHKITNDCVMAYNNEELCINLKTLLNKYPDTQSFIIQLLPTLYLIKKSEGKDLFNSFNPIKSSKPSPKTKSLNRSLFYLLSDLSTDYLYTDKWTIYNQLKGKISYLGEYEVGFSEYLYRLPEDEFIDLALEIEELLGNNKQDLSKRMKKLFR